jgi:copper chaperone CopZ
MTCATCALRIEKGLKNVAGVNQASVNLATEKATVEYAPGAVEDGQFEKLIRDLGYDAILEEEQEADSVSTAGSTDKEKELRQREIRKLRLSFIVSAALSLPLLVAMFAGMFRIEALMFLHSPIVQLALATPVQFVIGSRFYRHAFKSIRSGSPSMDVLVALGTSAAYLYSIYNGFFRSLPAGENPALYFEASAIIITLVLLGKLLEAAAKGRTSEAIKRLIGLQPKTARVLRDGQEVDIPHDHWGEHPGGEDHRRQSDRSHDQHLRCLYLQGGQGRQGYDAGSDYPDCRGSPRIQGADTTAGRQSCRDIRPGCSGYCRGYFSDLVAGSRKPHHRIDQRRGGFGDSLSLCYGAGHPHGDHGGHRKGGGERHPDPQR